MLARQSLPEGYVLSGTLRFKGFGKLFMVLAVLAVPWTLASSAGLGWLARFVRPQGWGHDDNVSVLPVSLGLAATVVLVIVAHEAVHGILMWTFTGARPVFGFKGWYFYTDLPGWYLGRWPTIAVLIGPLVVLTAIGLPVVALAPAALSLMALVGMVVNAIGAISDLYTVGVALWVRGPVYFGDAPGTGRGEAVAWYLPAARA